VNHPEPLARIIQLLCPSPARYLQYLVRRHGLQTGLDIGCGETSVLSALRSPTFRSTGIDVSAAAVETSRRRNLHDEYVVGDVRELDSQSGWEVIVLSQVVEHFTRDEGFRLLARLEDLAPRLLYVATPNGFREQPAICGNTAQRHLSGWFPHDFEGRGYSVFGMSLKGLRGVAGSSRVFPETITRTVERSTQWVSYRAPSIAGTIVAIRYVDEEGNVLRV
jgi:hypothetical protein